MLTIKYQTAFKKDYKRIVRRGYDVRLLEEVISILAEQKPLPEIYRDHNLSGDYIGCRECHITPDWLLIYEIKNDEIVLCLTRTRSKRRLDRLLSACAQSCESACFRVVKRRATSTIMRLLQRCPLQHARPRRPRRAALP